MNRRDAVKRVAILMGGALSASTLSVMLDSCNNGDQKGKGKDFTEDEKKMVSRMADVIIPRTDTPGAVDAGVPAFIVMMMQECYPQEDQKQFHDGLAAFDKWSDDQYGDPFLQLAAEEQEMAVSDLDKQILGKDKDTLEPSTGESHRQGLAGRKDQLDNDLNFYRKLKELTLLGFFTSKPGATETLRYVQVPGRYDGCMPYEEGDKAWAT